MALADYLPFREARRGRKRAQLLDANDQKVLAKVFKSVGLALGFTGGTYPGTRVNFEPAPYDFDRIIQAIDTDSYVKQAFNKYRELIWKEGFHVVSENEDSITYLEQRIDFMELSMHQSFPTFLSEVGDQLCKFANCFVVKVRGNLSPYFPTDLNPPSGKDPVIGYQIIPAETMEIMRDYKNNVVKYRQNIWGGQGGAVAGFGRPPGQEDLLPTWKPDEVIHFALDKKPGRVFGTPFMVSVMDDVVALRQIEEDIQNLIHRELFPLYKYKVGTEEHPAEPDEIDQAANELANLRNEGGLVLPDRHDVEVVGSENKALQADPYLNHFKERVAVGLGLSQHHLGMTANGGNRSVTDRLDVALYDKIKNIQRYLAGVIQLRVFNELLLEGGYDPYRTPAAEGVSDRCVFKFNEIDVDTQVKKENHIIQKWTADLLEQDEARIALGERAEVDEQKTYSAFTQRMLPTPGAPIKPGTSPISQGKEPGAKALSPSSGGSSNTPIKPDAVTPSTGGQPNRPNNIKKQVGNLSKPSNQFGRRLSPNIRHDEKWLNEVVELLDDDTID